MKEQFTGGEWEASKARYRASDAHDWVDICWSVGVGGFSIVGEVNGGATLDMNLGQMSEVCKANAHLIAAAPKMYRKLKEIAISMECCHGVDTDEIFELLAEARGEK